MACPFRARGPWGVGVARGSDGSGRWPVMVHGRGPAALIGASTGAWPDAAVKRLQLVAQIFANAPARKRADQALQEGEAERKRAEEAPRTSEQLARRVNLHLALGGSLQQPEPLLTSAASK